MALPPTQSPDTPAPGNRNDKQAAQQDVFLREVDDALREDQMVTFMRTWGRLVLGVLVVAIAAFGGWLWWDGHQRSVAGRQSEQLVVALDAVESGNLASADKQLEALAAADGSANVVAAKLARAGIAIQQNRPKDAATIYSGIAADADVPQPLRDLAVVREMAVRFDDVPPQQVVDRLKPLAMPGTPWFGPAGELVGLAYLKQGRKDLAGPLFAQIARDGDTPGTLRARARQMAGVLGVDAIDDAEKIVAETAGSGPGAGAQ